MYIAVKGNLQSGLMIGSREMTGGDKVIPCDSLKRKDTDLQSRLGVW